MYDAHKIIVRLAMFTLLTSTVAKSNNQSLKLTTTGKPQKQQSHDLLSKGQNYVKTAQKTLGSQLIQALNSNGTIGALNFCSENAIKLTQTAINDANVKIKRVSDLNRNPKNVANSTEREYIKQTKQKLQSHQTIEPQLMTDGNLTIGYYPILTNQLCLQCHGHPDHQINQTTLKKIQSLYPQDKAIGYDINQLRGIWVVEFMTKENTVKQ